MVVRDLNCFLTDKIADQLNISEQFIVAMENMKIDELPEKVYFFRIDPYQATRTISRGVCSRQDASYYIAIYQAFAIPDRLSGYTSRESARVCTMRAGRAI